MLISLDFIDWKVNNPVLSFSNTLIKFNENEQIFSKGLMRKYFNFSISSENIEKLYNQIKSNETNPFIVPIPYGRLYLNEKVANYNGKDEMNIKGNIWENTWDIWGKKADDDTIERKYTIEIYSNSDYLFYNKNTSQYQKNSFKARIKSDDNSILYLDSPINIDVSSDLLVIAPFIRAYLTNISEITKLNDKVGYFDVEFMEIFEGELV